MWENTTPITELPRDLCAGIGPLQLGVVLVLPFDYTEVILTNLQRNAATIHSKGFSPITNEVFFKNEIYLLKYMDN